MAGGTENDYEIENVNVEGDYSKSKNMIALENTIQDAKNSKKNICSTMDSIISLMKEVDHREKIAEEAVDEIGKNSLVIFAEVEELKQLKITANEANQALAKEVCAERDVLGAQMDVLQISVADLLSMGDSSVGVLDEIRRALEIRLTSALTKQDEAEKSNLNMEVSARYALAYEKRQAEKVMQESKRLNREVVKNLKMHQFLTHHGNEVSMLRGEITCKCQEVNKLKVKLDQAIILTDILSSSETSCDSNSEIIDLNKAVKL